MWRHEARHQRHTTVGVTGPPTDAHKDRGASLRFSRRCWWMDRRLTSAVPAAPTVRAPSPASPRSPPPRRRWMRGNARTRTRARQRGNRGTPGARAARGGQEQQRGTGAGLTSLAARVLSSAPGGVGGPHRATRHVDPGATRPRGPASRRRHARCVGGPSRHGTPPPCLWPRAVRPLPHARIPPRTPRGRLRVFRACTSACLGWASMTLSTARLSISRMAQILPYSLTEQASEGTCCRQGTTGSHRAMGVIAAVPWAGAEGSDRLQVSCIERDGLTMRGPCCLSRHARATQPWSTQTARPPHAAALRGTGLWGQRPRTAARRGQVRCGGACKRRALPLLSGWRSAVRSAGRTRYALQHKTR